MRSRRLLLSTILAVLSIAAARAEPTPSPTVADGSAEHPFVMPDMVVHRKNPVAAAQKPTDSKSTQAAAKDPPAGAPQLR